MTVKSATALGLNSSLEPGLVLINTTNFSGVSNVTISNVFSAAYDNYRVSWSFPDATNTATGPTYIRMASNGTQTTDTNYYRRNIQVNDANIVFSSESGIVHHYVGSLDTGETSWSGWSMDFISPFKAKPTVFNMNTFGYEGSLLAHIGGGVHITSASYDGFRWNIANGTVSGGTIKVYGYN
jgi:hypothetical protein